MPVISGHLGAIKIGANVVAEVEGWSIEVSREIYSYITLRQDFKGKAQGVGDWKGSLSARWYMGDTNGQAALQGLILGTTSAALAVSLEVDNPATGTYSGNIYVSSMKVDNSGDSLAMVDFDFEGSGTPTFV